MKITLGVDPGYDRVGVAVLSYDELLYSDIIITDRKQKIYERIAVICKEIKKIIYKFNPEYLAIEKIYFSQNTKTGINVAEARGAIIQICFDEGLQIFEYNPNDVKQAITSYGHADKNQIKFMVNKMIKLNVEELKSKKILDDEYDAIALALTHNFVYKN